MYWEISYGSGTISQYAKDKVCTLLYHDAAQKDTLRDALRITIAVSYSFFRRTVCPVYGVIFGYFYGVAFLIS